MDVEHPAHQEEGHAEPGQDEAVPEASSAQISGVVQDLFSVEGEDEAGREVCETCEGLTEACEVEEASSGHGEELTQEHQEGDGGEDHREDHEGLDGLQPVTFIGGSTQPGFGCIIMEAVVPEVSDL